MTPDFDLPTALPLIIGALAAYALGSIPFGLIVTRLAGVGDIRQIGSGNIGATNVLRTGRKGLAFITLFFDAAKGFLAVTLGALYGTDMMTAAAGGVVIGHMFPIWLGFKGGKGVATAGGVLFALSWQLGLAAAATWLIIAFLFRYSSLAALSAALLAPLYAWLFTKDTRATLIVALLVMLIIRRHRENIERLIQGKESKISLSRKTS